MGKEKSRKVVRVLKYGELLEEWHTGGAMCGMDLGVISMIMCKIVRKIGEDLMWLAGKVTLG